MKACLVSTTPTADREGRTQVDDGRQSTGTARRLSHGGAGIAHATADAVQVVRLAPLDFDLDCRVADSESSLDVIHHGAQHQSPAVVVVVFRSPLPLLAAISTRRRVSPRTA